MEENLKGPLPFQLTLRPYVPSFQLEGSKRSGTGSALPAQPLTESATSYLGDLARDLIEGKTSVAAWPGEGRAMVEYAQKSTLMLSEHSASLSLLHGHAPFSPCWPSCSFPGLHGQRKKKGNHEGRAFFGRGGRGAPTLLSFAISASLLRQQMFPTKILTIGLL